jgi:hypothetical protein
MFDSFGKDDPRKMPDYPFSGASHLDYATAVRADVSKQNCSSCPRHWYIDATFICARRGDRFVFAAGEQQFWYEELGFWVDSQAKDCGKCRRELRDLKALRQEYDREVAAALSRDADLGRKQRLLEVLDLLDRSGVKLPDGICENRGILLAQVEWLRSSGST